MSFKFDVTFAFELINTFVTGMNIFGLRLGLSDTTLHAHDATALEQKRATSNERDTHFCSRVGPSNLENLTEGPQPVY